MTDSDQSMEYLLTELQETRKRVAALEAEVSKRTQSEQALRATQLESDELYRSLFDNMLNGFTYCKMLFELGRPVDFVYLEVNKAAETLMGLTDAIGKKASEVFPGVRQSDPRIFEILGAVALTGQPVKFETYLEIARQWFAVSVYSPKPEYFVTVFEIITERKQAEEALRAGEEKFRLITDNIADIVITADETGRYTFISPSHKRVMGRGEEVIGASVFEYIHPEDMCEVLANFDKALPGGRSIRTEYRYLHPERGYIWLEAEGSFFDLQGARTGVVVARDITERKQSEKALRESEELNRMLFQSMAVGFVLHEVVTDENGAPKDLRILQVNQAFEQITGLAAEQITGRTLRELSSDVDPYWINLYGQVALTGAPSHFETFRSQINKYIEVNAYAPRQGQVAALVLDVTERKRAEEEKERLQTQLAQAKKMETVGRLAGGIAHDFNNMLMAIMGHTELALMQCDDVHPVHAHLNAVEKAVQRSAALVKQLLGFARKQTVLPKVMDLNDTIAGILKMLRRIIGEDIDLTWRPGADLWTVKIDPTQIDQILVNLCVNARDAIVGIGKISIETGNEEIDHLYCAQNNEFSPGKYVMMAVSDTGCGMEEETLAKIFEPFFTTKGVGKGTGLGLATVYGIVKQNDGFISVSSKPGRGACFKIYFHKYEGEIQAMPSEVQSEIPCGRGETILLVEDDPAALDIGKSMLEKLGYAVLGAPTPDEALELAKIYASEISVMLTDVIMPNMNGRDLARRMTSIKPELVCVFTSGYTANVIEHQGILDDAVLFLQKPYSMRNLAIIIRKALDKYAPPQERNAVRQPHILQ